MKDKLEMAQAIEDCIEKLWDGDNLSDELYKHVHSCPCIPYPYEHYANKVHPGITHSLAAFGRNFNLDNIRRQNRDQRMAVQMQRALWLTLLAELAERGEEFK